MFLFRRERNDPMMINQAKCFSSNYTNRVVHLFTAFLQSIVNMCKLTNGYIFGDVLTVNSRCYDICYGRYYVKKIVPLCTFLKFHIHLEGNLARSFQNVFNKCSRVFNLVFFKKWNFC